MNQGAESNLNKRMVRDLRDLHYTRFFAHACLKQRLQPRRRSSHLAITVLRLT